MPFISLLRNLIIHLHLKFPPKRREKTDSRCAVIIMPEVYE